MRSYSDDESQSSHVCQRMAVNLMLSVESHASSDNDEDEDMEDLDGGDVEPPPEVEPDVEMEEDNADGFDDDDQDDNQDDDSPSRQVQRRQASSTLPNGTQSLHRQALQNEYAASNGNTSDSHSRRQSVNDPFRPALRQEAVSAAMYDIVPTIAAPHSTSINTVTATPDMRWVFSGGSDGWVRKFNWVDTLNARSMLTVAQRHPFVDSVQKAGVLVGYWENEETKGRSQPYNVGSLSNLKPNPRQSQYRSVQRGKPVSIACILPRRSASSSLASIWH